MKAIILLYHRVIDLKTDPQLLAVNLKNFRTQITYLKKNYQIISLDFLVKKLRAGQVPEKGVVITFDDGYLDNYLYARPILEELNIPATFFISTANIGQDKEFWWDNLERIFLSEQKRPQVLKLETKGQAYNWQLNNRKQTEEAYRKIHSLLLKSSGKEIEKVIKYLLSWANVKEKARANYRPMNEREIREIAKKGMVTVGSHSHTHCVLAQQDSSGQRKEISQSKMILEEITGCKIRHFSYPFGTKNDYNRQTIKIVQNCGFSSACANFSEVVIRRSDVYQLPRILVRNWKLNLFLKKIKSL